MAPLTKKKRPSARAPARPIPLLVGVLFSRTTSEICDRADALAEVAGQSRSVWLARLVEAQPLGGKSWAALVRIRAARGAK